MENKSTKREKHPKKRGNIFTHFFFCWEIPLFLRGFKEEFKEEDLYSPLKEHDARSLGDDLETIWLLEREHRKKASLWRALVQRFGLEFLLYGLIYLPVNLSSMILKPFFLNKILDFCSGLQTISQKQAYMYAGLITALTFLHALVFNFLLMQMTVLGMKMRISCTSLIYRHILELKPKEMQQATLGKVINLLSNDVARFDDAFTFSHFIWIGPLQIIIGVCYLNLTVDKSASVGVGVLVLFVILCVFLSNKLAKRRTRVANATDSRMRILSDVVFGIRTIKINTWEEHFANVVHKARNTEMKEVKMANYLRFGITSFQMYLIPLSWLFNLLVFVLLGSRLTPNYVYTVANIYQDLLAPVTSYLPTSVTALAELCASVRRIEEFLLYGGIVTTSRYFPFGSKPSVRINVKFGQGSTFSASHGQLVGVVGSTGSGKSVLLQLILKEMEATSTTVDVEGTISYVPQDPWIFSATIRQNILFGEDLDMGRYTKILRVCALDEDLSRLPQGDETLCGERGVILSGGQKARVSLARAIYKDADIYLLDDPLSAVDSHVGRHIFNECILSYLKGKCVVLVTHHVHFLAHADKLYILENGKVRDCKIHDLVKKPVENVDSSQEIFCNETDTTERLQESRSSYQTREVYRRYCTTAGHWSFTVVVMFLLIVSQILKSATDYFLSFWVDAEILGLELTQKELLFWYGAIVVGLILATVVSLMSLVEYCTRSSRNLHNKLFSFVIRGKMTFFAQHSSGQIFNRFSEDIGAIDEVLPLFILFFILTTLVTTSMVIIACVVNYWMIVPAIILCVVVYFCSIVFQKTNKSLKRTEATTRSYIFSHVTSTVEGLITVRASKKEKMLSREFDQHQNLHTTAFYLLKAVYFAFGFWIALFCIFYTGILVFSFVFMSNKFSVGSVGLVITLVTFLPELFHHVVKNWCVVDTHMVSVERILEYIDWEPEGDDGNVTPLEQWPNEGNITFSTVSVRYSPDGPEVLNKISFHVSSGEKIGIVGRTGAGKTSLISTMFRLFDFQGTILIDGLDTKAVPLKTLRSKISIISQHPVLFVGSLRKNLDPCDQFTDEQIWLALDELELKGIVPAGLETEIQEGGSNFSVGQRQLLCLVSAILQRSKILVLDEATANVDSETDTLTQSIIKKKFKDCTVLAIAHRLNTVIDSDKILVLENGHVVEFDHPHKLLQNCQGFFYGYVKENGGKMMLDLMKSAENNYNHK